MANLRANRITSTEVFETTGSVQFDGDNDNLSIADSDDFTFGSGDFTLEAWIYPQQYGNYPSIINKFTTNDSSSQWFWSLESSGASGQAFWLYFGSSNYQIRNLGNVPLHQWTHCAVSRQGSSVRVFQNGILQGTLEVGSVSMNDTSVAVTIGTDGANLYDFEGHISNARILKGTALYTTNFTPPTRELEVIPNTVLLACQSTTKADEEKTGKTITVNGNAVANELTPGLLTNVVKSGGSSAITGSVEFDGTGDYLTAPNSSDFRLGNSDFTIEGWAYLSAFGTTRTLFALFENATARRSYQLEVRTTGAVRFEWWYDGSTSNNIDSASGIISLGSWNHYAVVRNGSTLTLYINGVSANSSNVGTNSFFENTTEPFLIGGNLQSAVFSQPWQGFVSNFRFIKGTALYTQNFIPPTRKLTKLPGTVLLCCQDPDNPLTEATGKTIVGYGNVQNGPGINIVKNGDFSDGITNWVGDSGANISASGGVATITNGGGDNLYAIRQENILVIGKTYRFTGTIVPTFSSGTANFRVRAGGIAVSYATTALTDGVSFNFDTGGVVADGASLEIGSGTPSDMTQFTLTNVYGETLDSTEASDFTPQVGSDGSVEFAGPTTINTENYFYLPTGPTEQRGRGRGVFGGGGAPAAVNTIDYIQIQSMGNAIDFGDLTTSVRIGASCSSETRGLFVGGFSDPTTKSTAIQYINLASTGNSLTFGSLSDGTYHNSGVSNSTRGVIAGGFNSTPYSDGIVYVTIASTGSAQTFGTLSAGRRMAAPNGVSSPTRGIWIGGQVPAGATNIMEYITIASTGNVETFGELNSSIGRYGIGSCSNSIRGVFGGGYQPTANINTIEYITIASTGNAQDFGDLTQLKRYTAAVASPTRGVWGGGGPTNVNVIESVTIASTGNAQDFGDLTQARQTSGSCSDSHGGLG